MALAIRPLVTGIVLVLVACAPVADPAAAEENVAAVEKPARRLVTICLTGACPGFGGDCASNRPFTDLCDELGRRPVGLVRSGTASTFVTAFHTDARRVVAPLFAVLDRNHDDRVDAADGPIDLAILGFSWGGVNSGDLAARIAADPRVDPSVVRQRVIVMDGYQPSAQMIRVPDHVHEAWSFRHTIAPPSDCSHVAPFGPYLGRRLACASGARCFDHDFSAAPEQIFAGRKGKDIGHCDVAAAATPYALELVTTGKVSTELPPSVDVTR